MVSCTGMRIRNRLGRVAWLLVLCGVLAPSLYAKDVDAVTRHERGEFSFSVGPLPHWVVDREPAAIWDPSAPGAQGAAWRNWLLDTQVDRRRGARERYFDRVYEPVSAEMIREAGKLQAWFSPGYQTLRLHRVSIRRGGRWQDRLDPAAVTLARRESRFENDLATGTVSALLVLDDIRVGDLVRVSYTISGENPIMGGLDFEEHALAWTDPILDRHVRILFDAGTRVQIHRDAGVSEVLERTVNGGHEVSASAHAVAALVNESAYPIWHPFVPRIVVGERRSWSDVAAWARALYPPAAPLPAELEQRIAEWMRLEGDDARAAAALRAVQEEVRYFGVELGESTHKPAEPAVTWKRHYGDCKDKARLLSTILGRLGVEAHPALVSAQTGKHVSQLPPSPSAFDHVIVRARINGETLWLDPTLTQQRGKLNSRLPRAYGLALPIAADAIALVDLTIPVSAVDRIRVTERFTTDPDTHRVAYEVRSEMAGASADMVRRQLQTEGKDAIARTYGDFYRSRYGELTADAELLVEDDESTNRMVLVERYVLMKPWLSDTPGQHVLETMADLIGQQITLPFTAARTAPLAVRHPYSIEYSTRFDLPHGWRWDGQAVQRTTKSRGFTFSLDARVDDKAVVIERRYQSLADSVAVDAVAEHVSALREASDLAGRRIVVSPPAHAAQQERDRRLRDVMRGIMDDNASRKKNTTKD